MTYSLLLHNICWRNPFTWDYKELIEAKEEIKRGAALANKALENSLISSENYYWQDYFHMREMQLESIKRMTRLASYICQTMPQGKLLAEIFEKLSVAIKYDMELTVIKILEL
ncbi:hypothetical protein HQN90_09605 [Paenibacillus alba]|uniref:hypothetical protein n=1 Tax=Paenibacillus alba TaxID=1197127 RepID=UPI001566C4E3|nr:hypothetical protein [Paenibacillus alba]